MTSCPFKVGDRIHETDRLDYISIYAAGGRVFNPPHFDESKPHATVTAITPDGFTYEYDTPFAIGRAQWGQMCTGGECYPEGYAYWRLLPQ